MEEKNPELKAELINPEDSSDFPYHATDIRNAILKGESELCTDKEEMEEVIRILSELRQ